MDNVICHIVGVNSDIKGKLINFLTSKKININVIDLDLITDKINQTKEMSEFYKELDELSEKAKLKTNLKRNKEIEKNMINFWKTKFQEDLDIEVKKYNNKIILIGLSTYFKNHRINVKIDSKLKFFVRVNLTLHAQNIIENNLNNYRNEIISGNFPLNLLDLDHLIQKREILLNIYKKFGYQLKSLNSIIEILASNISFDMSTVKDIYVATNKKFIKKIDLDESSGVGYTIPWLAIVSSLDNKNISKGFKKNKAFIKFNKNENKKILENDCYLYKVNSDGFYHNKNGKGIKFRASNSFKIDKSYYIDDIKKYLNDNDIEII